MAYIRRRKGSWQTVIRVQGYPPITKTFKTKIDAQRYSRDLENKLFREKHDIAKKKFPIMRDALTRYRDEVTAHKRSKEMETKLIKYILSEGFVNYAINLVDRSLIAQYRDRALRSLKSSSVNRRLAIISHLFTICKKEWGYDVANPVLSIRRPTNPEPIKLNLEPITKGRLLLEEMEADNKRLEEQRKKIFEKKQSDENIDGLAYLLNTYK
jgi:hypothetical protein